MNPQVDALTKSKFQNHTILVVEDNPANLWVISDFLKLSGFQVLAADDGESALKKAQYVRPDLVLLDVSMPGMDGYETCRRLKAMDIIKDIPVLFMSARAKAEDKVKGFELGAVDFLSKPIQNEEILARVTTHLRIRDLTRSLQKQNMHLEASGEVGRQVTSILEVDMLLIEVVRRVQPKFDYYFVSIWLLNESKDALVLKAGAGRKGMKTPKLGDCIPLDLANSIVSWVSRTGQSYLTYDVKNDSRYLAAEMLPNTRSEVAFPLRISGQVIGVLDIQSDHMATFKLEDGTILQGLANQIAVAFRNAQLYELEKQVRQVEEKRATELAELNASKDKFFAIISHDLRTPFQALLGNAELLTLAAGTLSTKEIKEMSNSIYYSAKNAFDLLDNLLQWSRLQQGKMPYAPETIDLKALTDQSVELLIDRAEQKAINLINAVEPNTIAYVDEQMIDTVIRNLISNALKFTPDGGEVKVVVNGSQAGFVQVAVADTGIGISPEDMEKLFKIGVHHSTAGTASEVGTGLGLIMCQDMVEQNGGQIWVESEIGQGTEVKFTVPVNGEAKA